MEELARHVSLGVERYNCFGLCGRGPNVSIDYADGREAMHHGVRSTPQSLDIIERAAGVRPGYNTRERCRSRRRGARLGLAPAGKLLSSSISRMKRVQLRTGRESTGARGLGEETDGAEAMLALMRGA